MSYKCINKCLRLSSKCINRSFGQPKFDGSSINMLKCTRVNGFSIIKLDIRLIHTTYILISKEISAGEGRRDKNVDPNIMASVNLEMLKESNQNNKANNEAKSLESKDSDEFSHKEEEIVPTVKLSRWGRVKKEFWHFYHGFKLFFLELKVTLGILNTLTKGQSLTRRERKQLVRTTADLARMIPFLVFIIVPFMELLLPFYIKFFPFMMPSPFQSNNKQSDKTRQILKGKLEIAKFLQETLAESTGAKKALIDGKVNMQTFSDFLKEVRESGLTANTEEILRYSQLFEDEVTLESLKHSQLKALCKMLELNVIGPPALLRFQLRMKVRHLKVDDQLIASEGLEKVPVWELQQLCRERGMRSIGVSEERLRYQLSQWLNLHLDKKVPITLLLLTRIIYLPETLTPEEKLKQAILVLPQSVSNEAKLKAVATEERADNKTKFEVIKEEQKVIQMERDEALKAAQMAVTVEVAESIKVAEDKAPIIKTTEEQPDIAAKVEIPKIATETLQITPEIKVEEVVSDISPTIAPQITVQDLSQIQSAIEKLKETKEIFAKQELENLKEIRDDTLKQIPEIAAPEPDKKKKMVADRLGAKVDKMISEMDSMFSSLDKEKGDDESAKGSPPTESTESDKQRRYEAKKLDQERFVSIADLKANLVEMDKLPDDAKWQHILSVLDADGDGMIELDRVLKMVSLLGPENVNFTDAEVTKLMEMIDKEAVVAESQKSGPGGPEQ